MDTVQLLSARDQARIGRGVLGGQTCVGAGVTVSSLPGKTGGPLVAGLSHTERTGRRASEYDHALTTALVLDV